MCVVLGEKRLHGLTLYLCDLSRFLVSVLYLWGAGESRCRQYEESSCKYGGHCNFMHIKRPSREVCKRLGIRTTYEAARGGGGGPGGGGGGGVYAEHMLVNAHSHMHSERVRRGALCGKLLCGWC